MTYRLLAGTGTLFWLLFRWCGVLQLDLDHWKTKLRKKKATDTHAGQRNVNVKTKMLRSQAGVKHRHYQASPSAKLRASVSTPPLKDAIYDIFLGQPPSISQDFLLEITF